MILCITPVWNEIAYIDFKVRWCKANGIDLYVINNESTDGTREYLVSNKIPFHDLHTGGSFNLDAIHADILETAGRIKPEWLIFLGCDLFAQTRVTTKELLSKTKENLVYLPTYIVVNTGEVPGNPLYTYYYVQQYINLPLIVRWHSRIGLSGDSFSHPNPTSIVADGFLINYGMTKPKEEMEQTLERRKKAWSEGLKITRGKHYLKAQQRNWTWNRDDLRDIRNIHPELIQKLQEQCTK